MKTDIVSLLKDSNELYIRQGDAYPILFTLYDQDNNLITPETCMDITICIGDIRKKYSENQIVYNSEENSWVFQLQQIESYHLLPGLVTVEVIIKFNQAQVVSQELDSIRVIQSENKVVY